MLDLESIFGDRPAAFAPNPEAPGPEPQAAPLGPSGGPAADCPALGPTDAPGDHGEPLQPQAEPSGVVSVGDVADELADAPDFSTWQPGSDFRGRMGWEPADVPEAVAWWRLCDFGDLPEAVWPGYFGDPRASAPQNRSQSTNASVSESEHVGGNRPSEAKYGALAGCKAGQG